MAKMMWRVHGAFWIPDQHVQAVVAGPAENIYEALGAAKSCFALKFPKLDTGTILIDFVEAVGDANWQDAMMGWDLVPIDEV